MTAILVCLLVAATSWALLEHWMRGNERDLVNALNEALTDSERDLQTANASARANRALAEARNDAMSEYSANRYMAELDYRLLVSSARCLPSLTDYPHESWAIGDAPIFEAVEKARRAAA